MRKFLILMAGIAVIFMFAPATASAECGLCGDLNGDGQVDIIDMVAFIDWFTYPDPIVPACPLAADVNCDGKINVNYADPYNPNWDLGYFIQWMFMGGPAPCDPDNDGNPNCAPY